MTRSLALLLLAVMFAGCGPSRAEILLEISTVEQQLTRAETELAAYDAKIGALQAMAQKVSIERAGLGISPEDAAKAAESSRETFDRARDARVHHLVEINKCRVRLAELRRQLE